MKTVPVEQFRESYDWRSAWEVACLNGSSVLGCDVSNDGVDMVHIHAVIGCDAGENDGPDWLALLWLDDGRFAFLQAGCDYTGWECQASGYFLYSDTLERMLQYGLTRDALVRMSDGT